MNPNIVTVYCVLILSTRWTWGLRCYDCFHQDKLHEDQVCLHPSQGLNTQPNATYEKTAQGNLTWYEGAARQTLRQVCLTYFGEFDHFTGVLRTQSQKQTTVTNGCIKADDVVQGYPALFFKGYACVCDTDLCNGSNVLDSYSDTPLNSSEGLLSFGLLTTSLTTATVLIFLA